VTLSNVRLITIITRIQQGRNPLATYALPLLAVLITAGCGFAPSSPSNTSQAAPVAHWALSGAVTSSAGGSISGAVVTVVDGPDANRTTSTDASGRFTLAGLAQGGVTIRVTARGYSDATMGITLIANLAVDVRLLLPLARLLDIGGSDIRYERASGGFEMYATAINEGEGCADRVGGVTTIKNAAPPNLTLDFSWSLPPDRIIRPGEQFTYRVGFMTDDQARQFPEGTASNRFSGVSIPCP
jgi:hypothetical protein